MSNTAETTPPPAPVATPEDASGRLPNDELFAPIRAIVKSAGITRKCQTLDDLTFATLCVLRVLHSSKTGRDFLQTHGIPTCPELTHGSYFKNLSSKRRLKFMRELAGHLNRNHLPALRAFEPGRVALPRRGGFPTIMLQGRASGLLAGRLSRAARFCFCERHPRLSGLWLAPSMTIRTLTLRFRMRLPSHVHHHFRHLGRRLFVRVTGAR
ncbi:MAG: hypothetical protein K9M97_09550 [Akkermansiaceae bacterium]|nr:hypothetical protein [Akkermansiaceae bacterium]